MDAPVPSTPAAAPPRLAGRSATTCRWKRSRRRSGTRSPRGQPLLSHAFLRRCTTPAALAAHRLAPRYLTAWRDGELVGALPLYAKTHSYGEYVFDWAWADAYRRHGRRYYPKLVAAIPFTPTPGPRLLAPDDATRARAASPRAARCSAARRPAPLLVAARAVPDGEPRPRVLRAQRHDRASRRAVPLGQSGLPRLRRFPRRVQSRQAQEGEAGAAQARRGRRRRSRARSAPRSRRRLGVLLPLLRAHLPRAPLDAVSVARVLRAHRRDDARAPAAGDRQRDGAAGLRGARRLRCATRSGAATGARRSTCPACISRRATTRRSSSASSARIARFEGGAQGVHKLARGLLPVTTYSAHAMADPGLRRARSPTFCARERADVAHAVDELETASPFTDADDGTGTVTEC